MNLDVESVEGLYRDGEETIAKHANWSYFYARDYLEGRFIGGEDAIAKEGDYALWYTTDVIKTRFEKGERAIKMDRHWDLYRKFLKTRGIIV